MPQMLTLQSRPAAMPPSAQHRTSAWRFATTCTWPGTRRGTPNTLRAPFPSWPWALSKRMANQINSTRLSSRLNSTELKSLRRAEQLTWQEGGAEVEGARHLLESRARHDDQARVLEHLHAIELVRGHTLRFRRRNGRRRKGDLREREIRSNKSSRVESSRVESNRVESSRVESSRVESSRDVPEGRRTWHHQWAASPPPPARSSCSSRWSPAHVALQGPRPPPYRTEASRQPTAATPGFVTPGPVKPGFAGTGSHGAGRGLTDPSSELKRGVRGDPADARVTNHQTDGENGYRAHGAWPT